MPSQLSAMNADNFTKLEIKYKRRRHLLPVHIQHIDIPCKYTYSCFFKILNKGDSILRKKNWEVSICY